MISSYRKLQRPLSSILNIKKSFKTYQLLSFQIHSNYNLLKDQSLELQPRQIKKYFCTNKIADTIAQIETNESETQTSSNIQKTQLKDLQQISYQQQASKQIKPLKKEKKKKQQNKQEKRAQQIQKFYIKQEQPTQNDKLLQFLQNDNMTSMTINITNFQNQIKQVKKTNKPKQKKNKSKQRTQITSQTNLQEYEQFYNLNKDQRQTLKRLKSELTDNIKIKIQQKYKSTLQNKQNSKIATDNKQKFQNTADNKYRHGLFNFKNKIKKIQQQQKSIKAQKQVIQQQNQIKPQIKIKIKQQISVKSVKQQKSLKTQQSQKSQKSIIKSQKSIIKQSNVERQTSFKRQKILKRQSSLRLQQKGEKKLLFKKQQSQIMSLQQVLQNALQQSAFPRIQQVRQYFCSITQPKQSNQSQQLIKITPFSFGCHTFRFLKYQVHLKQLLNDDESKMDQLRHKVVDAIKKVCSDVTSKASLRKQYMVKLIQNLLPLQGLNMFSKVYLQITYQYLNLLKRQPIKDSPRLAQMLLYVIHQNLLRILFSMDQTIQDYQIKQDQYLMHRKVTQQSLQFFLQIQSKIEFQDLMRIIRLCKFLKVFSIDFIEVIHEKIQISSQNYSMSQFLMIMSYLIESRNIPYQFFYKNVNKWIDVVEWSHQLSDKKSTCCIRLLQVFSRNKFHKCQKIYSQLLNNIQNNFDAMEGKQLVRTLYFYSKAKYGVNPRFVSLLVDRISKWMHLFQDRQLSLLVRALGNLNYQSQSLVQKLKQINYTLFVSELKSQFLNIGPYYRQILKQVDVQTNPKYKQKPKEQGQNGRLQTNKISINAIA